MAETVLNMGTAYKELRPLLFGALGKLARQGFVISPSDSLDLIHDFFVDAWTGLVSNYNPARGSFEAYAYGAFVHFARPRIVRQQRLRSILVEPEELDNLPDERIKMDLHFESNRDSKTVRNAISQLPLLERELLTYYVYASAPSERMLARKLKISRYRLRETLIQALGRVVVLLDKPDRMPERDWKVAIALWRDRRSIYQAAGYLGLTEHQVREANFRNVQLVAQALKQCQPLRGHRLRRKTMNSEYWLSPLALLNEALKSPGDEILLEQIQDRADEIVTVLEHSNSLELFEGEMRAIDPLWAADVYEAIAQSLTPPAEDVEIAEALFDANAQDEASIGHAFRETLMSDLPEHLQNLGLWFYGRPKIEDEEMKELRHSPSVEAGMPYSKEILEYGVTPLTFFYATEAVSGLVDRFMRIGLLDPNASVTLSSESVEAEYGRPDVLTVPTLIDEISRVAQCEEGNSHVLFRWSINVAQYKPLLFGGFRAEAVTEGVRLRRTPEHYGDVYQRWGLHTNIAFAQDAKV